MLPSPRLVHWSIVTLTGTIVLCGNLTTFSIKPWMLCLGNTDTAVCRQGGLWCCHGWNC